MNLCFTGDARDSATTRLVHELLRDDPGAALEWASSVNEQNRQTGLMRHVLSNWNQRDSGAARAGLNGAGNLSAEQRAELGQLFGGNGEPGE